jgi:hydroxymethylglutaryl-CoA lyase
MPGEAKIIECPRDAWQGLKGQIPAEVKAEYLRALITTGFKHIDAVSFVSPKAVPQMADSEQVLQQVDPPDDVEIIAIIMNTKGAERANRSNRWPPKLTWTWSRIFRWHLVIHMGIRTK